MHWESRTRYASALGGVQYIEFRPDDAVHATPLPLSSAGRHEFSQHLSLYYTGITRKAQGILKVQNQRNEQNKNALPAMRGLALQVRDTIMAHDWQGVGRLMDEGWQLKRTLADGITTSAID